MVSVCGMTVFGAIYGIEMSNTTFFFISVAIYFVCHAKTSHLYGCDTKNTNLNMYKLSAIHIHNITH